MDLSRDYPDGSYGRKFREDADKQMERLIEPPPSKNVKALPVPDDGPKKRRAGRRVRKAKEAYAITDLQKARNRMAFGEAEEEAMGIDSSEGLGMVGTSSGKIRAAAIDTRIKGTLNKRHKAIINATANASGFTTSLSFTPAQGIELENPDLRQPKGEAGKDKYFKNFKKFLYVDKNNKN
jgi:U4/U6 small nuclear ribonucleoprotein PRP31